MTALTGGEAGPLVAAGKLDVEVGDQGVDVIVPLHLQAEGRGEAQVLQLHCVDIHLLENTENTRFHICISHLLRSMSSGGANSNKQHSQSRKSSMNEGGLHHIFFGPDPILIFLFYFF